LTQDSNNDVTYDAMEDRDQPSAQDQEQR